MSVKAFSYAALTSGVKTAASSVCFQYIQASAMGYKSESSSYFSSATR